MNCKPELHEYQKVAVSHIHAHPRTGVFLDMGLGKTAVVLSSLRPEDLPAIVVAPKKVASDVWPVERDLWRPDLSIDVLNGEPKHREEVLKKVHTTDVFVVQKEYLAEIEPYAKSFHTLVVDELPQYKTPSAKRSKMLLKISRQVPRVIGLTGTPTPNGLLDLWHQLKVIDLGARLGTTLGGYRDRYFRPGRQLASGVVTEWLLRPGAEGRIHQLIDDICLSMGTEGRLSLPPITFNTVHVPLPPGAKKVYKELLEVMVANLDFIGGEVHTAANAAVLSSKLSQVTSGFLFVDDADIRDGKWDHIHDEKITALEEIVEGTGSPILVFYRYRPDRERILKAFPEARTIDSPGVVKDWNEGKVPMLVAHPQSAGHGLNLQHGGSTIVWFSPTWSLEEWEQGIKRLHRQNQKDPVIVHTLVCRGTVDVAIQERIRSKKTVQQALMDYLESPV